MTVQSATADPRFEPIRADEMLTIEISILSPLQRVQGPSQIIRGRHGLYIRLGGKLGLLLPQVWSELGCTAEEFARHTCVKAGLPPDAWKLPPTELFAFEAEIISN